MSILSFLCDFMEIGAFLGGARWPYLKIKEIPMYYLNYFLNPDNGNSNERSHFSNYNGTKVLEIGQKLT